MSRRDHGAHAQDLWNNFAWSRIRSGRIHPIGEFAANLVMENA